jgi:predicted nucleic acid-binding protein
MKVLDTTILIDYLDDQPSATGFLTEHANEELIVPIPAYAEAVVGEGNQPGAADIPGIENALAWGEIYDVDKRHALMGARIADEIEPAGPYLGGCDALIAAVSRELNAPVVSSDSDFTHPETQRVVDVEEY